jgi:hypothetical protein
LTYLSVQKLTNVDLANLINKVVGRLPSWKAALIYLASRATLVILVLNAIPIYHFIALHCPKWVLKVVNKNKKGLHYKTTTPLATHICVAKSSYMCC